MQLSGGGGRGSEVFSQPPILGAPSDPDRVALSLVVESAVPPPDSSARGGVLVRGTSVSFTSQKWDAVPRRARI